MRASLAVVTALIVPLLCVWPPTLPASETIPVSQGYSSPTPAASPSGRAVVSQPQFPEPLHPSPEQPQDRSQGSAALAPPPPAQTPASPHVPDLEPRRPETGVTGLLALLMPKQQDLDRAFLELVDPGAYRIKRAGPSLSSESKRDTLSRYDF
ncbi:MAG: hypothetical protein FJ118_10865 [Deltaproteobacteria bacterium]|nr:hypothetical protein [Deltaproteobacteria bacterium]